MTQPIETRRFVRVSFHAVATLIDNDLRLPVEILELSLKGATLELPEANIEFLSPHAALHLIIGDAGMEISMEIVLRNRDQKRIGVEWSSIDIDSLEHLRRLIELNSGDPEEVRTEMTSLSGQNPAR